MISASSLFLIPLVLWHKQFLGKIRNFALTPCSQQCLHPCCTCIGRACTRAEPCLGALPGSPLPSKDQLRASHFPPGPVPRADSVPREQLRCSLFPSEHFKGPPYPGCAQVFCACSDGSSFTCSSQAGLNSSLESFHLPTKG